MYLFNCSAFYTVRPVLYICPSSTVNALTVLRAPVCFHSSFASSCLYKASSAAADMFTAHCLLPAYYAMALLPLTTVAFHISL